MDGWREREGREGGRERGRGEGEGVGGGGEGEGDILIKIGYGLGVSLACQFFILLFQLISITINHHRYGIKQLLLLVNLNTDIQHTHCTRGFLYDSNIILCDKI